MAITSADILTYIASNRAFSEDYSYVIQDKASTMGRDAVASAVSWLWGRFLKAGRTDLYDEWYASVFTDLESTDLTNLDTVRSALATSDEDNEDRNVMLFDILVQLSVANLWQDSAQEETIRTVKEEAQEMLEAIIGADAFPQPEQGGVRDNPAEAIICIDAYTYDEITDLLGGYD